MLVNGSICLLVQNFPSPDAEPLSGLHCTPVVSLFDCVQQVQQDGGETREEEEEEGDRGPDGEEDRHRDSCDCRLMGSDSLAANFNSVLHQINDNYFEFVFTLKFGDH